MGRGEMVLLRIRDVPVLFTLGLSLWLAPPGDGTLRAAEPEEREAPGTELELERTLLEADRSRRETLARQRAEISQKLERLQRSLDESLRKGDSADAAQIRQYLDDLHRADAERAAVFADERTVVDRIAQRLERLQLLTEQNETRQTSRTQEVAGKLSGTWDLVLMPIEQRGSCALEQKGVVISGTYQLEGGWTG